MNTRVSRFARCCNCTAFVCITIFPIIARIAVVTVVVGIVVEVGAGAGVGIVVVV